jgi:DNA-binding XRE family transcriptional regulator
MTGRGPQGKVSKTAADRERHRVLRELCDRERPGPDQLTAGGRYAEPLPLEAYLAFRQAVLAIKAERERLGLTLQDVAEASGIHKRSLSGLETGESVKPTVDILLRYAAAVGCRLTWSVEGATRSGTGASGRRGARPG